MSGQEPEVAGAGALTCSATPKKKKMTRAVAADWLIGNDIKVFDVRFEALSAAQRENSLSRTYTNKETKKTKNTAMRAWNPSAYINPTRTHNPQPEESDNQTVSVRKSHSLNTQTMLKESGQQRIFFVYTSIRGCTNVRHFQRHRKALQDGRAPPPVRC